MADDFDAAYAQHEDPFESAYGPDPNEDPFERAYSRSIRALNGAPPTPSGQMGTLLDDAIDRGAGAVGGLATQARRFAVPSIASGLGALAGGLSPVPGGAFVGATAGSVAGDAFNRWLDNEPVADALSPANVARGALYSSMSGRGLADVGKLAIGNTLIDNVLDDRPEGENGALRLALQTAPALVAPGIRALRGGSAAPTPAQLSAQQSRPEMFPQAHNILARSPRDWELDAGISRAGPTPSTTIKHPWLWKNTESLRTLYPELRSVQGMFSRRNYPAAQEITKRASLHHDIARDIEQNGKAIVSEVLGRLTPDERMQFSRYAIWRDMQKSFGPEMRKAQAMMQTHPRVATQRIQTLRDRYAAFSPAQTTTPQHVVDAVNEVRLRVLQPFDDMNRLSNRKTINPATGQVSTYQSRGPEYFPRVEGARDPLQDPYEMAIARKDLTPDEAAIAQLSGHSPDYLVKARQDPIFDPDRFSQDPQEILDKYIKRNADSYALRVAWGEPVQAPSGEMLSHGEHAQRLLKDLTESGRRLDRDVFSRYLSRIYSPQIRDENIIGTIKRGVSRVALPFSFMRQIPQAANNVSLAGFGNTIRGALGREGRKFSLSGADDAAVQAYYQDVMQAPVESLPMRLLGGVESNWNRRGSAVGFGPHLRSLGQQALEEQAAGNGFSRRLAREAQVYDTTPDVLAAQTAQYGEPAWRRPMRQAIDMAQFHTDAGDVPESFRTGPLTLLTSYKGFPFRQTRLFGREAVGPMIEGIRHQDMGLFDLGLERTMRMLPTAAALSAPTMYGLSLLKGRDLTEEDIVNDTLDSTMGFYAPALRAIGSMAGGDPLNPRDVERSMYPASVSIAANAGRELASGDYDEFALRYALPVLDPTPSGILGMAGPFIHGNFLRDDRKKRR